MSGQLLMTSVKAYNVGDGKNVDLLWAVPDISLIEQFIVEYFDPDKRDWIPYDKFHGVVKGKNKVNFHPPQQIKINVHPHGKKRLSFRIKFKAKNGFMSDWETCFNEDPPQTDGGGEGCSGEILIEKYYVPLDGIAENGLVTIPNERVYRMGTNTLEVFRENLVLVRGVDYEEVLGGTQIKTLQDLPEGTLLVFKIYTCVEGIISNDGSININNRFVVDRTGDLYAANVNITGTVYSTAGSIGGWKVDSSHIYALTQNENQSLSVLNSTGALEFYSDRAALGVGHGDVLSVKVDPSGLYIPNGALDVSLAATGTGKIGINNEGIIATESFGNEVSITSYGIGFRNNDGDTVIAINSEGIVGQAIINQTISSNKFIKITPKMNAIVAEGLFSDASLGLAHLKLEWRISTLREDNSVYGLDDALGYRIYLKEEDEDWNPCLLFTDCFPDNQSAIPGDSDYLLKTVVLKNEIKANTTYYVGISAVDRLGNESTKSIATVLYIPDDVTVGAIQNLHGGSCDCYNTIIWNLLEDPSISLYEVWRSVSVDGINFNTPEWLMSTNASLAIDSNVESGLYYKYLVRGVHLLGVQGEFSEIIIRHVLRQSFSFLRKKLVLTEGLDARSLVSIPDGIQYHVGTSNLIVFHDSVLLEQDEYVEESSTSISFMNEMPAGSVISFMIFNPII